MSTTTRNVTRNESLLNQLQSWVSQLGQTLTLPVGSQERLSAIVAFCKTFVPLDVSEADTVHYANTLAADEVYIHIINLRCYLFFYYWLLS